MNSRTIDCHTHILTEETMALLQKEAPKIAPRLSAVEAESAVLEAAGVPYRPFLAAAGSSSAVLPTWRRPRSTCRCCRRRRRPISTIRRPR